MSGCIALRCSAKTRTCVLKTGDIGTATADAAAVDAITTPAFEFPAALAETDRKVLKDVLADVPTSSGAKYSAEKTALFEMIPQGGCWVNLPEHLQQEYMGASFHSGGGKRGILHRLSMDKPALTLLCTPSQKQTERCHPLEVRPLTVREYARIQTFDDTYEFVGSMNSQYKQIGNAVPVELARHMGIALKKAMNYCK